MATKIWKFVAVGRGRFPLDMLRYDACYPTDNEAVQQLDKCFPYAGMKGMPGEKRVTLVSHSSPEPQRWASFGWRIENVQTMRGA